MSRVEPTHAATAKSVPGTAVSTGSSVAAVNEGDVVDAEFGLGGKDAMRGGEKHGGAALALGDKRFHVVNGAAEREGLAAFGAV